MHEQVKLIQATLNKVLRHPFHGAPTTFTANYEVFYVLNAILKQQYIDTRIPVHLYPEQITALQVAGITQEDLDEVYRISGRNINLLQEILGDLMAENGLSVLAAETEINLVLLDYHQQRYPGNYKERLINASITDMDFQYVFAQYRTEALRGIIMFCHIPPKLAVRKLASCKEEETQLLWWHAKSTNLDMQNIFIDLLANGMNETIASNTILNFINEEKPGVLTSAQQDTIKSKEPLFVVHLFKPPFFKQVHTEIKSREIKKSLAPWQEQFFQFVNTSASPQKILQAHQDFIDCYERRQCIKLFSQANIAAALLRSAPENFTAPSNESIEAKIPEFLHYNPGYLHPLQPSLWLMAAGYIYENPLFFEVGLMITLALILSRNHLHKLNPCRYFKPREKARVEELQSLTNVASHSVG